jgi:hypothetical protein
VNAIINKVLAKYRSWDFVIFTIITLASVLNNQTTIFYLIYFFWWNEVICTVIDSFFNKYNPNSSIDSTTKKVGFNTFFLLGIYLVFIVVFFGFIANFENTSITTTNLGILAFQNWFFNANLLFVVVERVTLHLTNQPLQIYFGGFTPNMIVLHISIILGGLLMFFVVKQFPEIFTPDNAWGSVIILLPFLVLKKVVSP